MNLGLDLDLLACECPIILIERLLEISLCSVIRVHVHLAVESSLHPQHPKRRRGQRGKSMNECFSIHLTRRRSMVWMMSFYLTHLQYSGNLVHDDIH